MIDPVAARQATEALDSAARMDPADPPQVSDPPEAPDPADVRHFESALDAEPARTPPPEAGSAGEPGRLLRGLDAFSEDTARLRASVESTVGRVGEMGDLFRLQFEVATMTTTQTMVGQTGQKGSQGVQTLLKGQ